MTSPFSRPRAQAAAVIALMSSAALLLGACSTSEAADNSVQSPSAQVSPLSPARHTGPQGLAGQFVTDCGYSHSAPDDPIVFPGEPGMYPYYCSLHGTPSKGMVGRVQVAES